MKDNIKLVDVIIEIIDTRIPISSRHPDIAKLAAGKSRVIVLNKDDLADESCSKKWREYYETAGYNTAACNSKAGKGVRAVNDVVMKACSEKIERDRRKGIINRPVRAMIVGIPNVGKSTFINSFAGKACTKTGDRPGVTKGKQWIRLNKNVELLDTPGVLWPKFEDETVGINLALVGSINDEIIQLEELAYKLINRLSGSVYSDKLRDYIGCETEGDPYALLESFAKKRGCIAKGDSPDIKRAAILLMDDFRAGKIGRITLENVEDIR